jgi:two-component system, chemotaxis family, chemotaxis protein CheY
MGLKILVVDDSAFMRNILKNVIKEFPEHTVSEAVDGEDAIVKYRELMPNLVFMDIMMPKKTGLEALKEIRGFDTNAKIVMCTSVGQEKVMQEAIELGASDFIIKPFKPEDIKEVLRKSSSIF